MSPVEEIRRRLHADPFEPFNITTTTGRIFRVRSPHNVSLSPSGNTICVAAADHGHWLTPGEIVGAYPAEDVAAAALMEADSRGHRRGFDRGFRHGFGFGFAFGALLTATACYVYFMVLLLPSAHR